MEIKQCTQEWLKLADKLDEWLRANCKTPLDAAVLALIAMRYDEEYGLGATAAMVDEKTFQAVTKPPEQAN